ncbi:MAG TPA: hypothetical protein DIW77_02375 [Chromatiaceae bacterium]|nr:hypothetical protein [Chromatiaceae bacterium]
MVGLRWQACWDDLSDRLPDSSFACVAPVGCGPDATLGLAALLAPGCLPTVVRECLWSRRSDIRLSNWPRLSNAGVWHR